MADGSILIESKIDGKQFEKDLKSMEGSLKNAGKKMSEVGGKITKTVTLPIAAAFAGLAKAAMDLEATEAKYVTVFDGMTDAADEFIKEFQKLTPATTAEARSMASGMQDLLVPMGMARDEATEMTGELMHLAGALANFNSGTHSATDVTNAFQSALLGQYKPLAGLGIQLSQTEVQQRALEMGLADTKDELTKAHLAQVMMTMAYEQSGDALAAYTEENLDAKTMMGLAKAEIVDMAAEIGTNLLPIITNAISAVRDFTQMFSGLSQEQQQTILKVMGMLAVLGPLLIIVGKLITAVGTIIGVFTALNPIVLLVIGIVMALTAVVTYLWQENELFREKVIEIWEFISEFFLTTFEIITELFLTTFEFLKEFWDEWGQTILDSLIFVFTTIYEFLVLTFELIVAIIETAIEIIKTQWDLWGEHIMFAWNFLWETVKDVLSGAFDLIKGIITGSLDLIKGVFNLFIGALTGDWEKMWKGMGLIVKGAANVIISIINGIISAVEALVNAVARAVNAIPSFSIPSWVPGIGGKSFGLPNIPTVNLPKLPSFDVGTDRITRDGLAMVHRDEMVVPAKSTGPYTGANGGGIEQHITINSLTPLSPNEIKKKLSEQSRRLALEWR